MTSASTKRLKLLILFAIGVGALIASVTVRPDHASARTEDMIEELASYRTWTKVTKEPIKGNTIVEISTISVAAGAGG